MSWYKKFIKRLDSGSDPAPEGRKEMDEDSKDEGSGNIIELEEITIRSIVRKMKVLSYSNTRITGINFHFRGSKNTPAGLAGTELFESKDFRNLLYIELDKNAIKYAADCDLRLIYNSTSIDQMTPVNKNNNIGLEIKTPIDTTEKFRGIITIKRGYAWKEEYILEPDPKRVYKIGRGKNPELDNFLSIENDIAFISLDENPDPKYEINNYVSRSIAVIYFDRETNNFILKRSEFLNNLRHVIKIYSITAGGGFTETNLQHSSALYTLKDEDQIVINSKISMIFRKQIN